MSGDYKGDSPLVALIELVQWLSAPFGILRVSYSVLNFSSNAFMIEKNLKAFEWYLIMSLDALNEKIEKQQERLKQLKAQKLALEAKEKKRVAEQQRKEDTRKKILLGSYLLKKMNDNDANYQKILAELDAYLVEDRDRKLFGLSESVTVQA